ncbi:MAG: hypothetical protein UV45_C0019G0017 [Candidatus Azambacteria bacterium GW2011_GWB1_42_72]|nr:MAG: hypothetical protein UV45_C0019G0017 [Candidatus Azambacteria bacterium GW2011_GWB1_42_72]
MVSVLPITFGTVVLVESKIVIAAATCEPVKVFPVTVIFFVSTPLTSDVIASARYCW